MSQSKPMPSWFLPALLISGVLSLFGLIKKAKAEGMIRDEEEKP